MKEIWAMYVWRELYLSLNLSYSYHVRFSQPIHHFHIFSVAGYLITNLTERCWLTHMNSSRIYGTDFSRELTCTVPNGKDMNNSDISWLKKMIFRSLSLNQIELIKEDEWEGKGILSLSFTNHSCKFHLALTPGSLWVTEQRSQTHWVSGFGNQIVFFLKSKKVMQMQSLLISRHSTEHSTPKKTRWLTLVPKS